MRNIYTSGQDVHGYISVNTQAQPPLLINDYVFPPVIIDVNVLPYIRFEMFLQGVPGSPDRGKNKTLSCHPTSELLRCR